jgi:exodeoxyribonuclease VII small subunit
VGRKRKELSFEEAMDRLEELTAALEKGDLTLEEALVCFREGNDLLAHCQALLETAEKSLKVLGLEGTVFAPSEEEI